MVLIGASIAMLRESTHQPANLEDVDMEDDLLIYIQPEDDSIGTDAVSDTGKGIFVAIRISVATMAVSNIESISMLSSASVSDSVADGGWGTADCTLADGGISGIDGQRTVNQEPT
ncbi:uncharacterized protein LOC144716629 [Wolffia australiana]